MDLAEINQTQRHRLLYIDYRAWFFGQLGRAELINRFGMAEAAATRDIKQYKALAPNNLHYDAKSKSYKTNEQFQPLFDHQPQQVLATLAEGIGESLITEQSIPCEQPTQLNQPDLATLATLTRAIHQNRVVEIEYLSPESGESRRIIAPHVLVDNGLRWHVRGYCRKRADFIDFVINRIQAAKLLDEQPQVIETAQADQQWQTTIELELAPHPNIKHPKAIELDYAMVDGVRKQQVRAAVAGYLLRKWSVDCSENHSLIGAEFQLWLRNVTALGGVNNFSISPGYANELIAGSSNAFT